MKKATRPMLKHELIATAQRHGIIDSDGMVTNTKLDGQCIQQRPVGSQELLTLDDCLREFSAEESLGESNPWFCPSCKALRSAQKQIQLWSVPSVLVVHLKRFETNRGGSNRRKVTDDVKFPLEGFKLGHEHVLGVAPGHDNYYDLVGVINHIGSSANSGHYTAFVKDMASSQWYFYIRRHGCSPARAFQNLTRY